MNTYWQMDRDERLAAIGFAIEDAKHAGVAANQQRKWAAAQLGVSYKAVINLLGDPTGEKRAARKAKYAGVCSVCGGPTSGDGVSRPPARTCANCLGRGVNYRQNRSAVCGNPYCKNTKAPGRHVCVEHVAEMDRIRALFEYDEKHRGRTALRLKSAKKRLVAAELGVSAKEAWAMPDEELAA